MFLSFKKLKKIIILLVHRTHTECLMYPRQEPAGSRRGFRGVTATGINPLPSRTPLAKQPEYTEPLLHLFLLLLLSLWYHILVQTHMILSFKLFLLFLNYLFICLYYLLHLYSYYRWSKEGISCNKPRLML